MDTPLMLFAAFLLGGICYAGFHTLLARWSTQVRLRTAEEEWPAQRSLFVEVRQVQLDASCRLVMHLAIYNVSPFSWTVLHGGHVALRLGTGNPISILIDGAQIAAKTSQMLELKAIVPEPTDAERWLPVHIDRIVLNVGPERMPDIPMQVRYLNMNWCVAAEREVRGVKA